MNFRCGVCGAILESVHRNVYRVHLGHRLHDRSRNCIWNKRLEEPNACMFSPFGPPLPGVFVSIFGINLLN